MNQHHQLHPTSGSAPTPWRGGEAARENNTDKANSRPIGIKSPRQIRALRALLAGPIRREHLDRAAGASNSPDVVASLRQRGIRIDCDTTQPFIDRDGRQTFPGVYSLHADDRAKVVDLLKNSEVTTC
jgi:hypothetical protein